MPNRLILDTDGGLDDAQALLMLIGNGRTPMAVTTVFGNVSLSQATTNILDVLSIANVNVPVHAGAECALVEPPMDAKHIHGADGLGGALRPEKAARSASQHGIQFLLDTLLDAAEMGTQIDVLMIGPLTNLALAIRTNSQCVKGIGQLTIMGGTLLGRGNVTPAAEFNIFADPEAAAIVFGSDINILVAPWETCLESSLEGEIVDAVFERQEKNNCWHFSKVMCDRSRDISKRFNGTDRFLFVDPLAAAAVIDESTVRETLSAKLDVCLAPGTGRGMTVLNFDQGDRQHNTRLIVGADMETLSHMFSKSISLN